VNGPRQPRRPRQPEKDESEKSRRPGDPAGPAAFALTRSTPTHPDHEQWPGRAGCRHHDRPDGSPRPHSSPLSTDLGRGLAAGLVTT
jgi:hypothetical protein